MINISKPVIGEEEKEAVLKVLDSGMLAQDTQVLGLEENFKKITKAKHAIAVNNGTSALHTALVATGVKTGDEVITTPFTFIATANSILMTGAKPVFADIDPKTYNLDPKEVEKVITKKTKAILIVDLYGQAADYDAFINLAKKHDLLLIEDGAQSVGAKYKGKMTGNLVDIATFSLYATKNIMSGEGGIVTTNIDSFAEKARLFRSHGQDPEDKYNYLDFGYNYRMTDLQASIGRVQTDRLDHISQRRQEIARQYNKALEDVIGVDAPYVSDECEHVYHQYTLRVSSECRFSRDELKTYLTENGVGSNIFYPTPICEFTHLGGSDDVRRAQLKNSYTISEQVLSIPIHGVLTDADVNTIVQILKKI